MESDNAKPPRKILLVEDDEELCLTLGDRLRREGFAVEFAHDARAGLSKARTAAFDLIILDVLLPGESGLDVCFKLRKSGDRSPVLILTARAQTFQKIAGFRAGGDDYLIKPFDTAELLARLEALLRRPPSRAPSLYPIMVANAVAFFSMPRTGELHSVVTTLL